MWRSSLRISCERVEEVPSVQRAVDLFRFREECGTLSATLHIGAVPVFLFLVWCGVTTALGSVLAFPFRARPGVTTPGRLLY